MDTNAPKTVSLTDILRLRNRVAIYYIAVLMVLAGTLIWGMFVPSSPAGSPTCSAATGTMTQVLLGGTAGCVDEALWRLGFIAISILIGRWLATASSGEKSYKGLLSAIFTPDGNESPVLLELAYTWFLLATVSTAPFYSTPTFLIGVLFRLCRNSILAGVANYIMVRSTGIKNLDAYLRENYAAFSAGLPIYQGIAFLIAFYAGKALLGG